MSLANNIYIIKCSNCNETEHEPTAKFCHVCGYQLCHNRGKSSSVRVSNVYSKWLIILRCLLLFVVFIWYVAISVEEVKIDIPGAPWGSVTIGYVNVTAFLITLFLCVCANKGDFDDKRKGWRLYYEWLHFIVAAFVPYIGCLVATILNGWVLLLDSILIGTMILCSFGTLEDIISD